jgi:hypothetical protein
MQIIWIPFIGFSVGCLAFAFMLWRLEKAFSERHPDLWRDLTNSGFGKQYEHLGKLLNFRRSAIDDPLVAQRVHQLRWCAYIVFSVWIIFALALITGLGFRKL